jgi:hypothetical protein
MFLLLSPRVPIAILLLTIITSSSSPSSLLPPLTLAAETDHPCEVLGGGYGVGV